MSHIIHTNGVLLLYTGTMIENSKFSEISAIITAGVGALVFARGLDGAIQATHHNSEGHFPNSEDHVRPNSRKLDAVASLGLATAGAFTSWAAVVAARARGARLRS